MTASIHDSTRNYESWLGDHTPLITADLDLKHKRMADDRFSFFRASFYRFLQQTQEQAWYYAPRVLAVGDIHIENYGTWRDAEGRLCWGVNDFDEVGVFPYTLDLVRLATSAIIAHAGRELELDDDEICQAIVEGYSNGFADTGQGFVLEENHLWLRQMALAQRRDPGKYWDKLQHTPSVDDQEISDELRQTLAISFPEKIPLVFRHRIAGLGSLGRQRVLAIGTWAGGYIAREAKAMVPGAMSWLSGREEPLLYHKMLQQLGKAGARALDPCLRFYNGWVVRRLSPSSRRIELIDLDKAKGEHQLLAAMSQELAHIHRSSGPHASKIIHEDWRSRSKQFVFDAAMQMAELVNRDWYEWRR
jgi:hypothetical protein